MRDKKDSSKRILIVEDDTDEAEALKESLQLKGGEVRVALTGHDAVAQAKSFRPDIVFCDIGLPDMDGYEVARQLRADADLRSIRLFALSAYALPKHREQARRAGFEEHLTKPPAFDVLDKLIASSGH
jgi:CheY-like chemotaxis protein